MHSDGDSVGNKCSVKRYVGLKQNLHSKGQQSWFNRAIAFTKKQNKTNKTNFPIIEVAFSLLDTT